MPEKMSEFVKFRIELYKRLKEHETSFNYNDKQEGREEYAKMYIHFYTETEQILKMVDDILVRMKDEWEADDDF